MQQLAIPFTEQLVHFNVGSNWDDFRRFSPTGKVPCLHTGVGNVWDSLGIAEFLAERYPAVWPGNDAARAWARCASAEMHSGFAALREQCSMNCAAEIRLHEVSAALRKDLTRLEELWCEGLDKFGGPFLAGKQFTAVDAFFCPVALRVQTYNLQLNEKAATYAKRLLNLPAMRQWYAAALLEAPEPEHEAGCLKYGALIADKRQSKSA
jgi:glutathione S-transferase